MTRKYQNFTFLNYDELNKELLIQYQEIVTDAFPLIINRSSIVHTYWPKVLQTFPQYQRILITEENNIVGILNTLPFYWHKPLSELPDDGWDWLIQKGIQDSKTSQEPNLLGGLQMIVSKPFKGKGISTHLIREAKQLKETKGLNTLVIPIRPTFKHKYPEMPMEAYIQLQEDGKIFDPWIRTHLKHGARIISICSNSMNVKGDISFWESITGVELKKTESIKVLGALNLVHIDQEKNLGEYREDNIWIEHN